MLSAGGRDLPVGQEELGAPTVRDGIGRFLEATLGERERDLVARTVQIALRAGQARALPLASVRCWMGTLASRMEPRLLSAAADVRVLKEWSGKDRLTDEFLPVRMLWTVGEDPDFTPRGELKVEEGPFSGAPWDDLVLAVTDELGKP